MDAGVDSGSLIVQTRASFSEKLRLKFCSAINQFQKIKRHRWRQKSDLPNKGVSKGRRSAFLKQKIFCFVIVCLLLLFPGIKKRRVSLEFHSVFTEWPTIISNLELLDPTLK